MKIKKVKINEISDGLIDNNPEQLISYDDFEPEKYNGNLIVHDIMLFLRNFDKNIIKINLDDFLEKTKIDKNKFLTFLNEIDKTEKISFDIELNDDILIFKLKKINIV